MAKNSGVLKLEEQQECCFNMFCELMNTASKQPFLYFCYSVRNIYTYENKLSKEATINAILSEVFTILDEENILLVEKYITGGLVSCFLNKKKNDTLFRYWKPTNSQLKTIASPQTVKYVFPNGVYVDMQNSELK